MRIGRTLGAVRLDDVETRLRRELATLHARADQVFTRIGLSGGSIGARYERLFADARFLYPDNEAGRDAAGGRHEPAARTDARPWPMRRIDAPAFTFDAAARRLSAAELAEGKGGFREVPAPGHPGAYIVDLKDIRPPPALVARQRPSRTN